MLWTTRAHQSTYFQIFEYFNECSPNSSSQFWNYKVKVYSNFASLFSVMKGNCSVFFLSEAFILWTKRARQSEIFKLLSGWVKIHQIPYVIFKTTSQFFLNFASLFSVMRDNSSVLFYLKLYMIWTKGAHQRAKIQTFDCSHKISPNLYFDRFLKVYNNILAKKVQSSYFPWPWRLMQNLKKKTDLLFEKWQEFGEIWLKHSKVS